MEILPTWVIWLLIQFHFRQAKEATQTLWSWTKEATFHNNNNFPTQCQMDSECSNIRSNLSNFLLTDSTKCLDLDPDQFGRQTLISKEQSARIPTDRCQHRKLLSWKEWTLQIQISPKTRIRQALKRQWDAQEQLHTDLRVQAILEINHRIAILQVSKEKGCKLAILDSLFLDQSKVLQEWCTSREYGRKARILLWLIRNSKKLLKRFSSNNLAWIPLLLGLLLGQLLSTTSWEDIRRANQSGKARTIRLAIRKSPKCDLKCFDLNCN